MTNTDPFDDIYEELEGFECDCSMEGKSAYVTDDHDEDCALQMCEPFVNGEARWSAVLCELMPDYYQPGPPPPASQITKTHGYGSWPKKPPCEHERSQSPFALSNEKVIYLSSGGQHQLTPRVQVPDLHIMLAGSQRPLGVAWYIDWPDYGLPTLSDQYMWQVVDQVTDMLLDGKFIETGCMAAHGRTGTFVGLLELQVRYRMGMELPMHEEIVQYVRDGHCPRAVESDSQRWYLDVYRAHLLGLEPPPKPESNKKTTGSSSSAVNQLSFEEEF